MATSPEADEALVFEVLDAEDRRTRALHERDWAALEQLLDDDLTYTHLSGRTETKPVYLAGVEQRNHSVERFDLQVRIVGDVAVMTGGIAFGVQDAGGESSQLQGVALQVWVRHDGSWRLMALQATRTAPTAR